MRHVLPRLVLALAMTLALAACGGSTDEASEPAQSDPPETQSALPDRQPAPPLEGQTLDGAAIALDDFRGTPVLVNVWSSW